VQDIIRWHLHRRLNVPIEHCRITTSHYFLARGAPVTTFERVLFEHGITLHRVPGSRPAASQLTVALTLTAYETASTGGLDAIAVLTHDAGVIPLLDRMAQLGIHTTIIRTDREPTGERGGPQPAPGTPAALLHHAASTVPLANALDTASDDQWPLHPPFHRSDNTPTSREPHVRRRGTIQTWTPGRPYGFLLDTKDRCWFVHQDELPDNHIRFAPGTEVSFSGDPTPAPGRECPAAYNLTGPTRSETTGSGCGV
jgi:hypothetical protein